VNDRILRAARRQPVDVTPVWIMRQAGRYLPEYRAVREKIDFLPLCKTPDLAAEVTVQPVRRLGVDAAIIFSDILIPTEAMGMELELGDRGPHFPSPLRTAADIEKLAVPDPVERTGFVAEAIRRTRAALHDSVPVIGFAGAPFTLAAYMVEGGGSKSFILIKRLLFEQPKLASRRCSTAHPHPHPVPRDAGGGRRAHRADLRQLGWRAEPARLRDLQPPVPDPHGAGAPGEGRPVIVFGPRCPPICRCCGRPERTCSAATGASSSTRHVPWPARTWRSRATSTRSPLPPPGELEQRVADILRRAGPVGHIFNLGHGILPPTYGRREAPGGDGAPGRVSRQRAADPLGAPGRGRDVSHARGHHHSGVTTPTPPSAMRPGDSDSTPMPATVVTTGTAAAKRAVVMGPSAATARV
jgi:uroporphyrinogen decarboxylase